MEYPGSNTVRLCDDSSGCSVLNNSSSGSAGSVGSIIGKSNRRVGITGGYNGGDSIGITVAVFIFTIFSTFVNPESSELFSGSGTTTMSESTVGPLRRVSATASSPVVRTGGRTSGAALIDLSFNSAIFMVLPPRLKQALTYKIFIPVAIDFLIEAITIPNTILDIFRLTYQRLYSTRLLTWCVFGRNPIYILKSTAGNAVPCAKIMKEYIFVIKKTDVELYPRKSGEYVFD